MRSSAGPQDLLPVRIYTEDVRDTRPLRGGVTDSQKR